MFSWIFVYTANDILLELIVESVHLAGGYVIEIQGVFWNMLLNSSAGDDGQYFMMNAKCNVRFVVKYFDTFYTIRG